MKKHSIVLAFMLFTLGVAWNVSAEESKDSVLLFTGSQSWVHSPTVPGPNGSSCCELILRKVAGQLDCKLDWSCDGRVFDGDLSRYKAIIFYTCGKLHVAGKSPHAPGNIPLSEAGRAAFFKAIRSGVNFMGIHSATDTWYDEEYKGFIGATLLAHGYQQETNAYCIDPNALPGTVNTWGKKFRLMDEWYALGRFRDDIHVLMMQETKGMDTQGHNKCYACPDYPCTWLRKEGKGIVAYTSIGHSCEVWQMPEYQALLADLLSIVLNRKQVDFTPNLKECYKK